MDAEHIMQQIGGYKRDFESYLSRHTYDQRGLRINRGDDPKYRQQIREVMEFFQGSFRLSVSRIEAES